MFFTIFVSVIIPIFLLIGVGVVLDRKFHLDLPTLSKLNFYVFVPALTFIKLLEAKVSPQEMMTIGGFSVVHAALLFALSWFVFSHRQLRPQQTVLAMGTIFYNVGNYGIPLTLLAFGDQFIRVIAIVMVVQNLLTFTLGIWLMERDISSAAKALGGMLKVPIIYAVVAALLIRATHIMLPKELLEPLNYLSDGLIPIALLTLGVQLARTRLSRNVLSLSAISTMRLVVSPLLAALLVIPFGFSAPVSSVLIVAAGFPVAVNLSILATEYQQHEEVASQSIFLTTLLSAVTISLLLVLLR